MLGNILSTPQKDKHAAPFKVYAFLVYLMASNDIKFYIDEFDTSRVF